ncbi:MAG TPA: hypothetical protein VLH56_12945 [Dissulfurispiraceae bacterium]|nr:hypothetical protein [Dissulfurispiraceae bacterium]
MKKNNLAGCIALFCAALFAGALAAEAAEKPLPTVYWMSIATTNQTMPGMPREMPSGMFGGLGGGPKKTMLLQMNSPRQLPSNPQATHDIPDGMRMGPTLPLMIPQQEKPQRHDYEQAEERVEKDRMRILVYWGCSDTVRPGQPRVIDTATMSPAEISRAMRAGSITAQVPPAPGRMRIYAEWPNQKNSLQVPPESSLVGAHFVNGNYTPDIRFVIGAAHDFLAPVELNGVTGGLADSFAFDWRRIPNSLGYFSTVMAHTKNREMIVWSSSESYQFGWQLMDYISSPDVRRLVRDRVVMKPDQISCRIPKGIFSNAEGAMLQFIAYGEDLHFGYPPKPNDPVWGVRVRSKSTGMVPLGMDMEQRSGRGRSDETQADTPQLKEQPETERPSGPNPLNTIRGLFGF